MKRILSSIILIVILTCGISVFAEEKAVPVLMYHNINDNYNVENSNIEISNAAFKEHMQAINDAGYKTITFTEYINYCNGEGVLPEKPILLTFDDGYLNNYTNAFPLLKEMNMKATIFVVTGRMGMQGGVTYPHFTWEQAKEMESSGIIDIQSHTVYHNDLSAISDEDLIFELRKSRFMIYKYLGKKSDILAYPYGNFNDRVKEAAKEAGYKACVQIKLGLPGVNRKDEDMYELKRITAFGTMSGEDLIYNIGQNMGVE
ncbi:MAG: polysaccharide deacetylase family protein [Clostridia bacterium]|nr:polysaccharide deacetylase family protein [Clostridia bacterium]